MELLEIVYKAIEDRLGEDIVIINLEKVSPFNDYMMICSASNSRKAMAIVNNIKDEAYKNGYDVRSIEGDEQSDWILIDLYSIVVHVFVNNQRDVYNLENLWLDQPRVKLPL
ncbi:MAG: ribosome silencing factor [Erysipelotrichaceae bacterium]|nr:ribosome silencing factor [Erysipelotrichaceae bacterium]MDY5252490.1 ribosome silencing factor [Erysipelotrichaceae bacterium]